MHKRSGLESVYGFRQSVSGPEFVYGSRWSVYNACACYRPTLASGNVKPGPGFHAIAVAKIHFATATITSMAGRNVGSDDSEFVTNSCVQLSMYVHLIPYLSTCLNSTEEMGNKVHQLAPKPATLSYPKVTKMIILWKLAVRNPVTSEDKIITIYINKNKR